tara:strand:+ start:17 stop:520 length:504 start_codon:yes stop_codon:yes gene_type:complete
MDIINKLKKEYTIYGLINTLLYIFGSFLLLPCLQIIGKIKISLLNYIVWYVWSFAYTVYVLYILKGKSKQSNIDKVTYNWFVKGGFRSYQDVFLLSEIEPLYEYGLLGVLILIPVANEISLKRKAEIVLYKIAIFHITASFMLMDWNDMVVNYEFRSMDKAKDIDIE